ncbi:hypothetical protein [Nocardia sp. IFM 10818]
MKITFHYSWQDGGDTKWSYTSYLAVSTGGASYSPGNQRYDFLNVQPEEDGFSCSLKMPDGVYAGYWLDSKDGYLQARSSECRWRFIDKGPYYEWWQVPTGKSVRMIDERVKGGESQYIRAMTDPLPESAAAEFNIELA